MPSISIIIINYNGLQYTKDCIESLFQFRSSKSFEVIVVDNNSTDGSQTELPILFPEIIFLSLPENKGFGAANNIGAKKAKGELLFFVNNDTLFIDETIEKLAKFFSEQNDCGIISPKLMNGDRTFQLSFGKYPSIAVELDAKRISKDYSLQEKEEIVSNEPTQKDWVTGAAIMIKRDLFEAIGGFDERFFMYFEDIDLCRMIDKRGFKSFYIPSVSLVHLGGKSYGQKDPKIIFEYRRSQLLYYDKHNSLFQRIMVRLYIILKFFPKLFVMTDHLLAFNVLKLACTPQYYK